MSSEGGASARQRLYESYATTHAGCSSGEATALVYRRDIRPALPSPGAGPVIDLGCGQGRLVALLLADGYDAHGIDVSPEQVALARAAGVERVSQGDYRDVIGVRPAYYAAITATDVLEHLGKSEVLETFEQVLAALAPGGVLIARVPNAVSPLGGHIRYGDFTHESSFTANSVAQLAAASGFASVSIAECPPLAHGLASAARLAVWKPISMLYRLALAAETGIVRGHVVTQNLSFIAGKAE